jgi:hypothetical protein
MRTVNQNEFQLVVEYDEDPDTSYMDQEGFESEKHDYERELIAAYSVYAEVKLDINIGTKDRPFIVEHKVRTPGCHGVMLYTDVDPKENPHTQEIFEEESETLIDMITEMGMGVHRSKS